jgi:hypothetical protein
LQTVNSLLLRISTIFCCEIKYHGVYIYMVLDPNQVGATKIEVGELLRP